MSEWIEFDCGDEDRKCPVNDNSIIEVRLRDGNEWPVVDNSYWDWSNEGVNGDIVAYRVIE